MNHNKIHLNTCSPERGEGGRLIHCSRSEEERLERIRGRAPEAFLPPPSGQAQPWKTRYKSNGEVVLGIGDRLSPKNRVLATLGIGSPEWATSTWSGQKSGGGFERARLSLRIHYVFVANAPKTPFLRRDKPKGNR